MKKQLFLLTVLTLSVTLFGQKINIYPDSLLHIYNGGGSSFGLYAGHYNSMSDDSKDLVDKWLFEDARFTYIQQYFGDNPLTSPDKYVKFAEYVKRIQQVTPDLIVSAVMNNFPDEYMINRTIGGNEYEMLNIDMVGVYDSLAVWYLNTLNILHENGVTIDIFNMVNEPDYNKKWRYGYENQKEAIAILVQNVIPRLEAFLANNEKNIYSLTMPKIMAPSALSPYACLNYIKEWRNNYPDAWRYVDIVSTHQYASGSGKQEVFDDINALLDGREFIQSEQHTNRGDNLGNLPISDEHQGLISLGKVFSAAVSGGVNAWLYFQTNYPASYANGGLLRIKWNDNEPHRWKSYWAFRQLNSIQPLSSHVLYRHHNNLDGVHSVAFRKANEDTLYIHITNTNGEPVLVDLMPLSENNQYGIDSYKLWKTDSVDNIALIHQVDYTSAVSSCKVNLAPYSLSTVALALSDDGEYTTLTNQNITYTPVAQVLEGDEYVNIVASATSQLPIDIEIVDGFGEVINSQLNIDAPGHFTLKLSQDGDHQWYPAQDVYLSFCVLPTTPSFTVDGNTLTSSRDEYNQWMLDGEIIAGATAPSYTIVESGDYSLSSVCGDCLSSSSQQYVEYVQTQLPTPDVWYPLNANMLDKMQSMDATAHNIHYINDVERGMVAHLDTNQYISLDTALLSDVMSISMWINRQDNDEWKRIYEFYQDDENYLNLSPNNWSKLRGEFVYQNEKHYYGPSDFSLPYDQWSHLVVVINGHKQRLYYNGSLVGEVETPVGLSTLDVQQATVGYAYRNDRYMVANIDDIKIYHHAFNSDDIAYLYEQEQKSDSIAIVNFQPTVSIGDTLNLMIQSYPINDILLDVMWSVERISGDAIISQDGVLVPTDDGQLLVIANTRDGLHSDTINVEVLKKTTSLVDVSSGLEIYPNPADNYIIIKATEEAIMELWSVSGVKLKSYIVMENENATIDVSSFSQGYYFIKCKGTNAFAKSILIKHD